jgi:hypothetical protein
MAKIRLNFIRLSLSEKIAKARQIVAALIGNASFPTPTPGLATVTTAIDDLEVAAAAAQQARQTAKEKTSIQNGAEELLGKLISQLAAYVESVAGDDEKLILSAGMDARERSVAGTEPPLQPQALAGSAGDHDGEVDLAWDKVSGAKSYVIERSVDPPTATSWTHSGVCTRSASTVTGLTSGTRHWFRVAAVNANGQSGWSDPATKMAP